MVEAIPLALDMFLGFEQDLDDDGHNLGLDLKVRFEDGEFYIDDAILTEPSTGIYSARKEVAPNWLWRLLETDTNVRAAAEKAWANHEEYLAGEAADLRRAMREECPHD